MQILLENREPMERISRQLIRKETLERAELDELVASCEKQQVKQTA